MAHQDEGDEGSEEAACCSRAAAESQQQGPVLEVLHMLHDQGTQIPTKKVLDVVKQESQKELGPWLQLEPGLTLVLMPEQEQKLKTKPAAKEKTPTTQTWVSKLKSKLTPKPKPKMDIVEKGLGELEKHSPKQQKQ